MHRAKNSLKAESETPANTPQLKACSPLQHIGEDVLRLPPIVEEKYEALSRKIAAKGPPKLIRQRNTLVDVALDLEDRGYNIYGSPSKNISREVLHGVFEGRSHESNATAYSSRNALSKLASISK